MKRRKSIKTMDTLIERPPGQRTKRDALTVLSILDEIAKESEKRNQFNREAREG